MPSHAYDDILLLPHPVSAHRKRMTNLERAVQFAPFAALTGYDAVIREATRLTDAPPEWNECALAELDEKLRLLSEAIPLHPALTITYFQPDENKPGGQSVTVSGTLKKLRFLERELVLSDGTRIPLDAIQRLEGACFAALEA